MEKINSSNKKGKDTQYIPSVTQPPVKQPDAKTKVDSEVKGQVSSAELYGNLAGSGERLGGTQFAEFFRLGLMDGFGDKTGEDAYDYMTNELKRGKNLDFGLVKRAVSGAASRNGDNMKDVEAKLSDLEQGTSESKVSGADTAEGMDSAISHLTDHYDPTRILAFMEEVRRLTYQFLNNLKDNDFEEEAKQQMLKRAELKEQDQKREEIQ